MNAKIFPLTVEVDENIPSPKEKGDREAVEEVLAGRGIAPYGEFLKEEGIRGKKANTKQRTAAETPAIRSAPCPTRAETLCRPFHNTGSSKFALRSANGLLSPGKTRLFGGTVRKQNPREGTE